MPASIAEIQDLADQILEPLGARIRSGQMVIHYNDGLVQASRPTPSTGRRHGERPASIIAHRSSRRTDGFNAHAGDWRLPVSADFRAFSASAHFRVDAPPEWPKSLS